MSFFKLFEKKKKSEEPAAAAELDIIPPPPLAESTLYSDLPTLPEKEREPMPKLEPLGTSFEKPSAKEFYEQVLSQPSQTPEPMKPEPSAEPKSQPWEPPKLAPLDFRPFESSSQGAKPEERQKAERAFAIPRTHPPAHMGEANGHFVEAQTLRGLLKNTTFVAAFSKKYRSAHSKMEDITRREEAALESWHKTLEDMQRRLVLIDHELERG